MTYNFLSQTNSSEFNLYEYVDDESLMIEATMGDRSHYGSQNGIYNKSIFLYSY